MYTLPQFDELHVISDLHLGGEQGFQIFDQGQRVTRLVNHLRRRPNKLHVGLVINGDLVDFLAERRTTTYFDPVGATAELERIFRDPAFVPVWQSLQRFASTSKRSLIITLGNHDLELSLPWVQEQLLRKLSGDKAAARGRITLAFDGQGYRCRVGKATVLCTHGNEVDTWNVTPYEALRRIGRDAQLGTVRTDWVPSSGARLVIDVMNDIKETYPFVDALKPEVGAVIPTLLALDPRLAAKAGSALPSFARRGWDALRRSTGFLGQGDVAPGPTPEGGLARMLSDTFGEDGRQAIRYDDLDFLLEETEVRLMQGIEPMQLVTASDGAEFLGIIGAVRNLFKRKGRSEVLREALEGLGKDQNFELKLADATYLALNQRATPEVDFLISGHTHLERALPLSGQNRFYYNSGTWARLIRLTPEILGDSGRFKSFYDAIERTAIERTAAKGTAITRTDGMAELDKLPNVVLRVPTVVSIWVEREKVRSELRHVADSGEPPYECVNGSQFVWS
jgi:UDP-2,3-diacylglucosamine pyrophosphatase LpxH